MDFFNEISRIYTSYASYVWDTIRHPFEAENYFYYLIYVSLAVWILEMLMPWRKNQKILRKDFWIDAFYMFFNFYIFNLIIFIALSSLSEKYFGNVMEGIGLPRKGIIDLSGSSLWIQFPIFFILADLTQWSIHVILHRVPWLWKFHKVHHSVTEMGFAAHLRYHWLETLVYKTGLYIIMAWLLNFRLEHAFFLHAFTILIGHLNHANISLDYGPLKYILNNPKMHIWHHAKHMPASHPNGINFGITLSIWDYLFKTNHIPYDGRDIELGFEGIENYPDGFLDLQVEPFKEKQNKKLMKEKDLFILSIVGSLTLGLAPFVPHAHIWKQIMNIVHSRPMAGLDWFDLVLHGTPWVVFIVLGIRKLAGKAKW